MGGSVHEFGLCEGVLETVRTRAAGRPVTGIRVRCGVRHAVDPESMAQAFGFVAAGTEADGAAVEVVTVPAEDNPACECGAILRGVKKPTDCKLFGTVCTPETPMGSCMVSSEGACAAHWSYGRFRDRSRAAVERQAAE